MKRRLFVFLICFVGINLLALNSSFAGNISIAELITPELFGMNVAFFEKKVGPAKYDYHDRKIYEINGCELEISGEKSISMIRIDVSPKCNFNLSPFLGLVGDLFVYDMTFGQFKKAAGDVVYLADCLRGCGNAFDPSIYQFYSGPRYLGFLEIKVISYDALGASDAWELIMEKEQGEDWIMDRKFNCDYRYTNQADEIFKDSRVAAIEIGYELDRDDCD